MRLPLAALAVALIAAIGLVPLPAIGASPDFALSCGSAAAGADVPCTVSRASAGKGLYVLFQTADGSGRAGTDYTAVKQLLYFKASALSQTVAVHTAVNPAATGTLTFTAAIAASTLVVRATGSIVEPPPIPIPPPPPAPTALAPGGFAIVQNWPGWNNQMVELLAADESIYGWNNALAAAAPTVRRPWACHFVGQTRTLFFMPEDLVPSAPPPP